MNVVVISHALWQRRFGGDRGIIGRTMLMNDVKFEVIGVAPESFVFINREVDYWVPIQLPPAQVDTRRSHFLNVVARLKPGVSVQAADGEMRAMATRMQAQYPETNRDVGAVVVPMREQVLGDTRVEVIALAIAAVAIVLIACANLASLLLARASVRRGEYAVRLSLGATRARLARQVLIEALCLSVAGGVLGLAIPSSRARSSSGSCLRACRLEHLGARLAAAVVRGRALDRHWRALQSRPSGAVRARLNSRSAAAARAREHRRLARRFRDGLVVLQVAATLVLLGRRRSDAADARQPQRHRVGFQRRQSAHDAGGPAAGEVCRTGHAYGVFDRVVSEVRALPGVHAAAFASTLPFQATGNTRFFAIEGRPISPGDVPDALFRAGTGDYLRTLGVSLIEGRLLDARDDVDAPLSVVVNETLVRRFMPEQSVLGRRIRFGGPTEPMYTVVGVVRDVLERGYEQEAKPGVYVSVAQAGAQAANIVVRVTGDPLSYAPAVQRIIQQVDPDQPTRLCDR